MTSRPPSEPAGLYVHLPFCRRKCLYNFCPTLDYGYNQSGHFPGKRYPGNANIHAACF